MNYDAADCGPAAGFSAEVTGAVSGAPVFSEIATVPSGAVPFLASAP
jgi:hypothetical protein